MNYPTFLSEVDRMSAALDAEALRAFVHELARTIRKPNGYVFWRC